VRYNRGQKKTPKEEDTEEEEEEHRPRMVEATES
jgi:hypothetical protein